MILELKDKLKTEAAIEKYEDVKVAIVKNGKVEEAISALQVLGYTKREIEQVLEKIDLKSLELEEIIKQALKYLARN